MLESEYDNLTKWNGKQKPFYEVYYLKLNEPSLGVALWLRYTFLSPSFGVAPSASVWAIFSNSRDPSKNLALKETVSMSETVFLKSRFGLDIGGAVLNNNSASGGLRGDKGSISWDISWAPADKSFKHYPSLLYLLPWPASKVVAPNLAVPAHGWFDVNGVKYPFNSILHQGHIWGRRYSERWVWADCGVFKEDRSAMLELLGRPGFGLGYLKTGGVSIRFLTHNRFTPLGCEFRCRRFSVKVAGKITAEPQNIIGVAYQDPSGGERYCYNTKVANAVVDIYKKKGLGWVHSQQLTSLGTTAFETVWPNPLDGMSLVL